MFRPKVVLAPTDFSELSFAAVETAAELANRLAAKLLLVHVVPMLTRLPAGVSIFKEGDYEQGLQKHAAKQLADLSAKVEKTGVAVQTDLGMANDVGAEVLRIGEHRQADLIVIATHGMSGWKEFVFGSVAEKIVRTARCSTLVLKAQPRG
jgi:nucleotide-binding universal stress UspA family protein